MTIDDFKALRSRLRLTQAEMAARLGMSLRAVQDIEGGISKLRPVHAAAAERVALTIAVERGEPELAPDEVRRQALELARLLADG